jgi:hypothetical protein
MLITRRRVIMSTFFRLISAGPLFFVSAWILMIFAGIVHTDVGIRPFGYLTSMVVTIGLWLVIAPAATAVSQSSRKRGTK